MRLWDALFCILVASIHSVNSKEEIDAPKTTFNPEFLHHFIEDEMIRGYEEPKLHFYFTPLTFDCYFKVEYKSKEEGAPNLLSFFEDFFLNGLILDRKIFEEKLEKQKDFTVPAKKFGLLERKNTSYELYLVDKITEPAMLTYLKNIQVLLKFFIENGSYIEEDDDMWKLMLMIEKVDSFD